MEYLKYAFEILIMTILFAIPGILIDAWMVAQGLIRGDKVSVVIGVLCLVLIKIIWFNSVSWWLWGAAIVLGMIFAVHRADLWATMKKGRWWWKPENVNKDF
jgi:uncharacterized membrane protein